MITPLGNRVIIEQKEVQKISPGGIHLAPNAQDKPSEGTVVSIGSTVTEVTTGDIVMYGKYSGTEIEVENKKYLLVKEQDIIAIVTNTKNCNELK